MKKCKCKCGCKLGKLLAKLLGGVLPEVLPCMNCTQPGPWHKYPSYQFNS